MHEHFVDGIHLCGLTNELVHLLHLSDHLRILIPLVSCNVRSDGSLRSILLFVLDCTWHRFCNDDPFLCTLLRLSLLLGLSRFGTCLLVNIVGIREFGNDL